MSSQSPDPCPKARALRVLIAGDTAQSAEAIAMVLSFEGHAVAVARPGGKVQGLTEAVCPDVAVLELGSVCVDGFDLARQIRQTPWGACTLMIALCAAGDDENASQARTSGFDEKFTKPLDPCRLLSCIAAWRKNRQLPAVPA